MGRAFRPIGQIPGHKRLIDWGRTFVEGTVLVELHDRNSTKPAQTSSHIWIHRDAPQVVKEALRLLCYSGILQEGVSGVRATRSEVGTRYMVNLGCQFALDSDPISSGSSVRRSLSIKRMAEFGANHPAFKPIKDFPLGDLDTNDNLTLEARLRAPSDVLDLTRFQKQKIQELKLRTIGQVLASDEVAFKKAYYSATNELDRCVMRQLRRCLSTSPDRTKVCRITLAAPTEALLQPSICK